MLTTTLALLKTANACAARYRHLCEALGGVAAWGYGAAVLRESALTRCTCGAAGRHTGALVFGQRLPGAVQPPGGARRRGTGRRRLRVRAACLRPRRRLHARARGAGARHRQPERHRRLPALPLRLCRQRLRRRGASRCCAQTQRCRSRLAPRSRRWRATRRARFSATRSTTRRWWTGAAWPRRAARACTCTGTATRRTLPSCLPPRARRASWC